MSQPFTGDRVLTVKQPWAWLIIHGGKDIENRGWPSNYRGRLWIHASAKKLRRDYDQAAYVLCKTQPGLRLPRFESLETGAIIGSVRMTGCVPASTSRWFSGPYGFTLCDPEPCEPVRCAGQLMIWKY